MAGILWQRRRDPLALACAVNHQRLLPACCQTYSGPFVFNELQTRVHQELKRWVVLPEHRFPGQPWTAWASRSLCGHGGRQPGSDRLKCVCDNNKGNKCSLEMPFAKMRCFARIQNGTGHGTEQVTYRSYLAQKKMTNDVCRVPTTQRMCFRASSSPAGLQPMSNGSKMHVIVTKTITPGFHGAQRQKKTQITPQGLN